MVLTARTDAYFHGNFFEAVHLVIVVERVAFGERGFIRYAVPVRGWTSLGPS